MNSFVHSLMLSRKKTSLIKSDVYFWPQINDILRLQVYFCGAIFNLENISVTVCGFCPDFLDKNEPFV